MSSSNGGSSRDPRPHRSQLASLERRPDEPYLSCSRTGCPHAAAAAPGTAAAHLAAPPDKRRCRAHSRGGGRSHVCPVLPRSPRDSAPRGRIRAARPGLSGDIRRRPRDRLRGNRHAQGRTMVGALLGLAGDNRRAGRHRRRRRYARHDLLAAAARDGGRGRRSPGGAGAVRLQPADHPAPQFPDVANGHRTRSAGRPACGQAAARRGCRGCRFRASRCAPICACCSCCHGAGATIGFAAGAAATAGLLGS